MQSGPEPLACRRFVEQSGEIAHEQCAWEGGPAIHRGAGVRAPTPGGRGSTFVIAAGEPAAVDAAAPLFESIGQKTFVVSDTPQAANLVKLSGNFLIGAVIESLGVATAVVGKAGIDRWQYIDISTSALFGAPFYSTYGGLIADGAFEPAGFAAPLGFKDIRLALAGCGRLARADAACQPAAGPLPDFARSWR